MLPPSPAVGMRQWRVTRLDSCATHVWEVVVCPHDGLEAPRERKVSMRIETGRLFTPTAPTAPTVLAVSLLVLVSTGACSRGTITVPPVTPQPTGVHEVGKFVWYDLLTSEPDSVRRFYSELFGWQFESGEGGSARYTVITRKGTPIAGVVQMDRGEVSKARWLSYLSVADVDSAVDYVRDTGGLVYAEPGDLPNRGRYAVVSDPQGAVLAFLRSSGGDPLGRDTPDYPFEPGDWLWTELWTHDIDAAREFYKSLAGYDYQTIDFGDGNDYYVMKNGEQLYSGILELPWPEVEPNWLPYVVVEDLEMTIRRTEALGGRVLVAPQTEEERQMAIIADPSGAVLNVQEWHPELAKRRLDDK